MGYLRPVSNHVEHPEESSTMISDIEFILNLAQLRAGYISGDQTEYTENDIMDLVSAINEDQPLLSTDQYLS